MKILLTGAYGHLGSSICSALINSNYETFIIDSVDDEDTVNAIFKETKIDFVIHCAGKASIDVSMADPYRYYKSNLVKSIEFFNILKENNCKNIIFASSASIYDDVVGFSVTEESPISPRSPFARSKYMTELILKDFCDAYGFRCISLRYFNPIGLDPYNKGELPKHNIINAILSAVKNDTGFLINGFDWATQDGTCIRDYIHLSDICNANILALRNFDNAFKNGNFTPINIGSGIGTSVLQLVFAYENVTGCPVKTQMGERRTGDVIGTYANISKAKELLGWKPEFTLEEGILDIANYN